MTNSSYQKNTNEDDLMISCTGQNPNANFREDEGAYIPSTDDQIHTGRRDTRSITNKRH